VDDRSGEWLTEKTPAPDARHAAYIVGLWSLCRRSGRELLAAAHETTLALSPLEIGKVVTILERHLQLLGILVVVIRLTRDSK